MFVGNAGLSAMQPESLPEMVYGDPAFEGADAESRFRAQSEVMFLTIFWN